MQVMVEPLNRRGGGSRAIYLHDSREALLSDIEALFTDPISDISELPIR